MFTFLATLAIASRLGTGNALEATRGHHVDSLANPPLPGGHDHVFDGYPFAENTNRLTTDGSNWPKRFDVFGGKHEKRRLQWWQKCTFYEIYPRSFKDTNGDGVGDLRGVIEKIPYLKDLGIGAVWLSPIYPSPGVDMGYDITDFRGIDPLMGTEDDFDELKEKLHENGMKIVLDFVPNHTSDQHEWFVKSVQRVEPYTDYYVWADGKYVNGTRQVPNNWLSLVEAKGTVWTWNEQRKQYYLHQFSKEQPDLNYWNPKVREEMKDLLRYWLDRGVDGFRLDAVPFLYERQDLMDIKEQPEEYDQKRKIMFSLDETYEELKVWRAITDEYEKRDGKPRILAAEIYERMEYVKKCYGNSTHPGVHFPLNVCLMALSRQPARFYVEHISMLLTQFPVENWPAWNIGNHDIPPRVASRYGDELLDGVHMVLMLLPGTPVVYMADELGTTEGYLRHDQLIYEWSKTQSYDARELVRRPFQWDPTAQAGFSDNAKPWLPVNPNYATLNAKDQQAAARSHLKTFKQLARLRQNQVFRTGDVRLYEVSEFVFAFSRSKGPFKSYFIVINLGTEMENVNLRSVERLLPHTMTVRVASTNAEQDIGDLVKVESFALRPNAALVLESSFF